MKKENAPDSYLTKLDFNSPAGFFANEDDTFKVGHQLMEMVLHCTFNGKPCNMSDFVLHQDPGFYNCWVFTGASTISKDGIYLGPQAGLSLILYTDYAPNSPVSEYLFNNVISGGNGIRVHISESENYPTPLESGIDISAGQSSSLSLAMQKHSRLGKPWSMCSSKLPKSVGKKYVYSLNVCRKICLQNVVLGKCNCLTTNGITLDLELERNVTYCIGMNPARNITQLFESRQCELEIVRNFNYSQCDCLWPCNEIIFSTEMSTSFWPVNHVTPDLIYDLFLTEENNVMQQNLIDYLYNIEINDEHYNEKLNSLKQTLKDVFDAKAAFHMSFAPPEMHGQGHVPPGGQGHPPPEGQSHTLSEGQNHPALKGQDSPAPGGHGHGKQSPQLKPPTLEANLSEHLVIWSHHNLARLNIYFRKETVELHHQRPSYDITSFLSETGGTLGLWAGLSIITLTEILSFVFGLLPTFCKSGTDKKVTAQEFIKTDKTLPADLSNSTE